MAGRNDYRAYYFYRPLSQSEQASAIKYLQDHKGQSISEIQKGLDNLLFKLSVAQNSVVSPISSQDINITERKSLISADNSVKNDTFVEEKNALQIIQDETFQDAVLDECERLWPETADMTLVEIAKFLKSKGKVTTGIKDVQAWIGTLKC